MMKRFILIAALMLLGIFCLAQSNTKVVLKNGTTITGKLKEFNPTSHVILSVSGIDSRIEMVDIASLESLDAETISDEPQDKGKEAILVTLEPTATLDDVPKEILALENYSFPDTYTINIGDVQMEMVLIPGGLFRMGYDGRGSWKMSSEPIHNVYVNSFYISKSSLTEDDVASIKGKGNRNKKANKKPYTTLNWDSSSKIVSLLSEKTRMKLRLPSEAEWEYIVSNTDLSRKISFNKGEANFCYDYFTEYPNSKNIIVNPLGPDKGQGHVVRFYAEEPEEYCFRHVQQYSTIGDSAQIRFVICAIDLIESLGKK